MFPCHLCYVIMFKFICVLINVCTGTKPLQTIFVQVAIQTRWPSFRRKQTWFVHLFCILVISVYVLM